MKRTVALGLALTVCACSPIKGTADAVIRETSVKNGRVVVDDALASQTWHAVFAIPKAEASNVEVSVPQGFTSLRRKSPGSDLIEVFSGEMDGAQCHIYVYEGAEWDSAHGKIDLATEAAVTIDFSCDPA